MLMQLTPEHEALRATTQRFIAEKVNPFVDQWEADEIFPAHQVFKGMGELGLLGLDKPVENGGSGLDFSYAAVFAEALADINCGAIPMATGVQTDMATPALAKRGSAELRAEFLAPAIAGDYVACLGVSEVGSGSDVASILTKARKVGGEGGDYLINGGKMWTTNGTQADFCCVLANTSDVSAATPGHKNKSLIIVPMKTPGVSVARKLKKIGMAASDTAQLHFDDVRVPQRYRIGEEGMGFMMQMIQFQEERLYGAANSLKMLDKLIDLTIEYCKERHTFGQPLINNQVIHFRLAELRTEVELLRSLVYRAVDEYVQGKDVTKMASMAKLKCGRLIREVADSCLQYWGGMGFTHDNPISQAYRDGRLVSIGGGADEIMLGIICKFEGTLPKKAR